jgi:hypothetical protein
MDDLKERLRKVEGSVKYGADPGGTVTCWHRNPDGPEALSRIEALEQRVSELEEALSEVVTLLEGWHRLNFADEIQQQGVRLAKRALAKARNEQVKQ